MSRPLFNPSDRGRCLIGRVTALAHEPIPFDSARLLKDHARAAVEHFRAAAEAPQDSLTNLERAELEALRAAAERFIAQVDRGEARSIRTYAELKAALAIGKGR